MPGGLTTFLPTPGDMCREELGAQGVPRPQSLRVTSTCPSMPITCILAESVASAF